MFTVQYSTTYMPKESIGGTDTMFKFKEVYIVPPGIVTCIHDEVR